MKLNLGSYIHPLEGYINRIASTWGFSRMKELRQAHTIKKPSNYSANLLA